MDLDFSERHVERLVDPLDLVLQYAYPTKNG